jgi:hypothetical protein
MAARAVGEDGDLLDGGGVWGGVMHFGDLQFLSQTCAKHPRLWQGRTNKRTIRIRGKFAFLNLELFSAMNDSNTSVELPKVIKRLELIKGLIALQEEDEVSAHTSRLKHPENPALVTEIIELLEAEKWSEALEKIDAFLRETSSLDRYIDPKIEAVKIEVKSLENSIVSLRSEIAETEKVINQFLLTHNQQLGPIIIKILGIKQEQLKSAASNAEGEAKWHEAKREYQEYQDQLSDSESREVAVLNEEQKFELKALYKKAALMCHPDKVSDELRELAEQIFKELNEANRKNDLGRVREIHDDVVNQKFRSRSDTVNEYDKLMAIRSSLLSKQKALVNELRAMKEAETYQTIMSIDDWDEYFRSTRQALEEQLNNLQ